MLRKIIIVILFALMSSGLFSQQEKYDKQVDAGTYELYTKFEWNKLIDEANDAFDRGIDFYYLRIRTGIAYYANENYLSAIPQFEHSLMFRPADTVSLEYLYFSYLLSGNESEAMITGNKLPLSVKIRIKYSPPKFFKGAYTEGGYSYNRNQEKIKNRNMFGNGGRAAEQTVFENSTYINLSLMHSLGNRVSVFQGYNNISVKSTQQFAEQIMGKNDFEVKTNQNEYYINTNINAGKGFEFFAALHYLNVKSESVLLTVDTSVFPPIASFTLSANTSNQFAFASGLSKNIGHITAGYSVLFSNLNMAKQIQNTFTFVWYPLGNLNLYAVTNFIFHSNKKNYEKGFLTRGLLDVKAGVKAADKLWLEGVFTSGKLYNFSESNAFIVYNNIDKINYKLGANLIYVVSPRIELSARFQYMQQELYTLTHTSPTTYVITTDNFPIIKLIGGLKWTF
jgi:hypothetical protein